MSDADRQAAIDLARKLQEEITVYEAVADPQSFSILHKKVAL
jgi:hypothetical protein